jgi:hypothetical protein
MHRGDTTKQAHFRLNGTVTGNSLGFGGDSSPVYAELARLLPLGAGARLAHSTGGGFHRREVHMSLDTLVVVLPVFGLVIGASLGALAVHWLREARPAWWPGSRGE